MIDPDLLRRIRNDLPMQVTIGLLGNEAPPKGFTGVPRLTLRMTAPHPGLPR